MDIENWGSGHWRPRSVNEPTSPEHPARSAGRHYTSNRRYEDLSDQSSNCLYLEDHDRRTRERHSSILPDTDRGDAWSEQGSCLKSGHSRRALPLIGGSRQDQGFLSPRSYDSFERPRGRTSRRAPYPNQQMVHEFDGPQLHQSQGTPRLALYTPSPPRPVSGYFEAQIGRPSSVSSFIEDSDVHRARSTGDIREPMFKDQPTRRAYLQGNTFVHAPLFDPRTEIRLLSIDRKINDTIYCRIHHEELLPNGSWQPYYTALSYTWGSKGPTSTIVIDYGDETRNRTFQVTQSLYKFLEHVVALGITPGRKHPRYTKLWWIDAICIIQNEVDDVLREKTVQLDMMPQIYYNAAEVYAWIGPGSLDEIHAMRYISKTKSLIAAAEDGYDSDQLAKVRSRLDAMGPYIEKLFQAEYWGRLWILQELAVSANTTLACATAEVRWERLVNFATHVAVINRNRHSAIVKRQYVWLLSLIYDEQRKRLNLATLIHLSEQAECTDQKDRIIALLGLRPGNNLTRPRVAPGFKFPCETFYWAMHEMIRELKSTTPTDVSRREQKLQECSSLARRAHRQPTREEHIHGRHCENLVICRNIARVIVGNDPIVLEHNFENGDRWCFYRNHMKRDKSRSRSRSRSQTRSRSRSHSGNEGRDGTSLGRGHGSREPRSRRRDDLSRRRSRSRERKFFGLLPLLPR